jgi:hypothetical protein
MSKNIKIALPLFVGLAVIAFFASSSLTRAQRTMSGEWKASIKEDGNKLQLNLERRTERAVTIKWVSRTISASCRV